jgi:hydrogenase/urease accessory protein HupE
MSVSRILLGLLTLFPLALWAHPIPELPIKSVFQADGKAEIRAEADPRLFQPLPDKAPYLLRAEWAGMSKEKQDELIQQAIRYMGERISFHLEPVGEIKPQFEWSFTSPDKAFSNEPEDYIVLTGRAKLTVPQGISGYRIRALPVGDRAVTFINEVAGKEVVRTQVLFPGEDSYVLDLSQLRGASATALPDAVRADSAGSWLHVMWDNVRRGFHHVVPDGPDHLLFVLGLFLLSRSFKPLLWQVTAFTVAHTITLGLATFGLVSVSGDVVEPVIAASIAFVAIENLFRAQHSWWRVLVVFIFGLIHGLGFAGALAIQDMPESSMLVALIGSNVGVELAQLSVLAVAWLLTCWVKPEKVYRKWVVLPGSAAIAITGLWWTVERVFG